MGVATTDRFGGTEVTSDKPIAITIADDSIENAVSGLPRYSAESFVECAGGVWKGDFIVSCGEAPELAEGDLMCRLI